MAMLYLLSKLSCSGRLDALLILPCVCFNMEGGLTVLIYLKDT